MFLLSSAFIIQANIFLSAQVTRVVPVVAESNVSPSEQTQKPRSDTGVRAVNVPVFPDMTFEHIDRKTGLSNLAVSAMVQDRFGYVWIGTQGGLNRYDGTSFTVFENDPFNENSLSQNQVQTLYLDEGEVLWIGTYLGLNRLDTRTGKITRYMHDPSNEFSLSNDVVVRIFRDRGGRLWVGTLDGLNRMGPDGKTFIRYPIDPDRPGTIRHKVIRDIKEDRNGRLWVATGGGLHRYHPENDSFDRYLHDDKDDTSIASSEVMAITEDREGGLWFACWNGGLSRYDPDHDNFKSYSFPDNRLYAIAAPQGPFVYAGSWGGGLYVFDPHSATYRVYKRGLDAVRSLSHDTVYSILQDRTGMLWIGTNGGGINLYNPQRNRFQSVLGNPANPAGLGGGKVTAILEDRTGRLWVGTYNGGLNRLDPGKNVWKHYRALDKSPGALSNDIITEMFEDSDGNIWIGTNAGLNRYLEPGDRFEVIKPDSSGPARLGLPDHIVFSILEDKDKSLWFGTYTQGLARWDRSNKRWTYFESNDGDPETLSDNLVYSMTFDNDGKLWVGTNKGLNLLDPRTGKVRRWFHDPRNPESLSSDTIRVIYYDTKGQLWVGTAGGGLDLYDAQTDNFIHYTKAQGLAGNSVVSILEDDAGKLWVGTMEGLCTLDPRSMQFRTYTDEDGLQDIEFSAAATKLRSGIMIFGGPRGYSIVDRTDSRPPGMKPPVRISSVALFNKTKDFLFPLSLEKDISFSFEENYLSFRFATLDFANPRKNAYAWKLEGFEQDWNYANGQSFANYTNLPAGNYTFRVKGASANGVWNDEGDSIRVKVMPHPALSWWAFSLYAVALGLIVVTLARLRTAQLMRRRYEEMKAVKAELEEANAKLAFLSTHDELTGLPNRRYMNERLQQEWERAIRDNRPISVIMIDVDFFKAFNDRYGHLNGDSALSQVAEAMKMAIKRSADLIGRYGGEEFVAIMPATDEAGALGVAESMRNLVGEASIEHAAGVRGQVLTISLGVATAIPKQGVEARSIIAAADAALYRAKAQGRDRVVQHATT